MSSLRRTAPSDSRMPSAPQDLVHCTKSKTVRVGRSGMLPDRTLSTCSERRREPTKATLALNFNSKVKPRRLNFARFLGFLGADEERVPIYLDHLSRHPLIHSLRSSVGSRFHLSSCIISLDDRPFVSAPPPPPRTTTTTTTSNKQHSHLLCSPPYDRRAILIHCIKVEAKTTPFTPGMTNTAHA